MRRTATRIARWFRSSGSSADAQGRVGVVDIGSNSVRLVVWDGDRRTPEVFHNEKALCGLGSDLARTGRLPPDGARRAMAAIRRFAELNARLNVVSLAAVGTAALREAADGPEFARRAGRMLGCEVNVASGEDEARLAAQGVLYGEPNARGVVADMGGASLELCALDTKADEPIGARLSTPLGSLRLTRAGADAAAIDAQLEAAQSMFAADQPLYLVGGSWRAAMKAEMRRAGYPLPVLHGFRLTADDAATAMTWVAERTPAEIEELTGVSERRAEVTPAAALALARLIAALKPSAVQLSAFGLREGALWELMSPEVQARDPLLDACRAIEARGARSPGYGDELWRWLSPVLTVDGAEARLGHAACVLSEVAWRSHPEFRARVAMELVTRNNFGGVDHPGRMFVGAALLHRLKRGRRAARDEPALALLDAEAAKRAAAIGRGARLAATLSGAVSGLLPLTRLERDGDRLRLVLGRARAVVGEEVDKRLRSFARALDLTPELAP